MQDVEELYQKLVFLMDSDYEHKRSRRFVGNLLKRKKEWLFNFVMDPDVELTNNRAERSQAFRDIQEGLRWIEI
jgi:hypothetical protein